MPWRHCGYSLRRDPAWHCGEAYSSKENFVTLTFRRGTPSSRKETLFRCPRHNGVCLKELWASRFDFTVDSSSCPAVQLSGVFEVMARSCHRNAHWVMAVLVALL